MVTIPLDTSVPAQRPWFRSWADFPNLALTTTFSAVNRNVYQVRRWERDPMGISRRSQDFFQNNLVCATLRGQDAFLRQPRVQLGRGPDPLPFRDRFYSQNLVLTTLRGQDQRPPRTQVFDRPILTVQPDRSWVWPSPIQLLAAIPFPLNQYSWPLPIRAAQPDRFWVQNLVLGTLAGQDTPLVGQQFWERPRATVQLDRSFTATPFPLFAVLPFPTNQYDWPLPARAIQPDRTWIQNLIGTTLAGQDQFLTQPRQFTELPRPPNRPDRSFVGLFNPNLIGQDAVPANQFVWPLPLRASVPYREWIWVSPSLIYSFTPFPLNQYYWPLPLRAVQPDRTWIQSLLTRTLAGDRPFNQLSWPLPGRFAPSDRSYTAQLFPGLTVVIQPMPFNQYSWPLPTGPIYPVSLRTFVAFRTDVVLVGHFVQRYSMESPVYPQIFMGTAQYSVGYPLFIGTGYLLKWRK